MLVGLVLTLASLWLAREYSRRTPLPRFDGSPTPPRKATAGFEVAVPELDEGPEEYALAVSRLYYRAAYAGVMVTMAGGIWMMF